MDDTDYYYVSYETEHKIGGMVIRQEKNYENQKLNLLFVSNYLEEKLQEPAVILVYNKISEAQFNFWAKKYIMGTE